MRRKEAFGRMSGGGIRCKRCAFPSMALLPECFPLFLGRVFSPPRVWLGRDVQGRGTARSRLRLKACDSMTVFHGLLASSSDARFSLAARRLHTMEGIALFGAVLFCCAG